jgi:hypothetical protein
MYSSQVLRPRRRRRSTWNLGEPARDSKGAATSGVLVGGMTVTEFTVTRWHCMEYPDPETPHELTLARGEDGSGGASLRGANLVPSLGRLIRIRHSKGHTRRKQARLRVNRHGAGPSGPAQGLALRAARVARPCGVGVSSEGHGTGEDP